MLHRNIQEGDMHSIQQWEVADATARAALVLTVADEGKVCRQLDTEDYFVLTDYAIPTWKSLVTSSYVPPAPEPRLSTPVRNKTGVSVSKAQIVYLTGEDSGVTTIALAKADSLSSSAKVTLAVVADTIADSANGFVLVSGVIDGIDTSSYSLGDTIYLSPVTAGGITNTKPVTPFLIIKIGTVVKADATLGMIALDINPSYSLQGLVDVSMGSIADKYILIWNDSSKTWEASSSLWESASSNLSDISGESLVGNAGKVLGVNPGETAIELIVVSGGGGGGLTNFTEATNSSTPNATVPANSLVALNAASSVDFVIAPKGTGALITKVPNNSTKGNKRGQYAVDLQLAPIASNTRIASGNYSSLVGGANNTASGAYTSVVGGANNLVSSSHGAIVGGEGNAVTGDHASVVGGLANTAAGDYSSILGGSGITVAGNYSATIGGQGHTLTGRYSAFLGGLSNTKTGYYGASYGSYSNDSGRYSAVALGVGTGYFGAGSGEAQKVDQVFMGTTDLYDPSINLSANSAAAYYSKIVTNNTCYAFTGIVSCYNATSDIASAWKIEGVIKRSSSAATTAFVGTPLVSLIAQDTGAAGYTVTPAVNSSGEFYLTVLGDTTESVRWSATITTQEVRGA